MKKILMLLLSTFLFACNEYFEDKSGELDALHGTWIEQNYSDSTQIFIKSDSLLDDIYGITFKSNGDFVERKNIGWCGTPPVTFGNYDGSYNRNDSIVEIEVPYWGGMSNYKWQIISVSEDELEIYWLEQEYYMENEN